MILTSKQEQGLKIAVDRYLNKEKFTVISGMAGTGKSTLVRCIIEALPVKEEDVAFATYTGKAAQVLVKKGNKNAMTLHKLLFDSFPKPDGTFFRKPKREIGYKLIIIDEVSMVPKTLIDLLFSHKAHVICLGDPFQLPPIDKNEDNHLLDHPHIFLDEIMRQEAESEIIQLTMKIRNHEPIDFFEGNEVKVLDRHELNTGMMMWADQILVATNKTRIAVNNQMRQLLGRTSDTPQEDDKIICLRNYWDTLSWGEHDSLINGTIGTLRNITQMKRAIPRWVGGGNIDVTIADFVTDNGDGFYGLDMDTHMIMTGEKCMDKTTAFKLGRNPKTAGFIPYEFTYGYAITYWKAQGSEYDKVLVIEESFPFDAETHARAMYTALTRASQKVVWLR